MPGRCDGFATALFGAVFALLPDHLRAQSVEGSECLPRDIISLVRGDAVARVREQCKRDKEVVCSAVCMEAVLALKHERCFAHLSQSQQLQSRMRGPTLPAMAGIWYGLYPAGGVELLELRYDPRSSTLSGTKLTGNQFVRAGRVSFEATPKGCRVVSSMWAGAYAPRWDPCSLTMWEDHISIDLGGSEEEQLTFVRAKAPLLFEWDEPRAPTYELAAMFASCDVRIEDGFSFGGKSLSNIWEELHHGEHTAVLDQALVFFPMLLVGGWQLSSTNQQPLLVMLATLYIVLVCARLRYLGYLS